MRQYKVIESGKHKQKRLDPVCPECTAAGNKPSAVVPFGLSSHYEVTWILRRKYRVTMCKCNCGCYFEHRVRVK
jgi:hypothetical protein